LLGLLGLIGRKEKSDWEERKVRLKEKSDWEERKFRLGGKKIQTGRK
jgi:hypothetical protein